MEQAIQNLYDELLRLKANGLQSLYVETTSIEALSAVRHKQMSHSLEVPSAHETTDNLKQEKKYVSNNSAPKADSDRSAEIKRHLPAGTIDEKLTWLEKQYCTDFKLIGPSSFLFGSGGQQAEIVVCRYQGEADSAHSKQRALLSKVFQAMELDQQSIYSTHLIKCSPNHDPYDARAVEKNLVPNEHLPYLMAQLECIQPKVLLVLGKACHDILLGNHSDRQFAQNRGQWQNLHQIPVMTSYDPNYLLQNDTLESKRQFWEDMLKLLEKLKKPISRKQANYFLPRNTG